MAVLKKDREEREKLKKKIDCAIIQMKAKHMISWKRVWRFYSALTVEIREFTKFEKIVLEFKATVSEQRARKPMPGRFKMILNDEKHIK